MIAIIRQICITARFCAWFTEAPMSNKTFFNSRSRLVVVFAVLFLGAVSLVGAAERNSRDDASVAPVAAAAVNIQEMAQFKIVAPVNGTTHSVRTKDFNGNSVPVLRELPSSDPRFQQLKTYIENDSGLEKVMGMAYQARVGKTQQLQQQLSQGTRDPALVKWLLADTQKPVYLEIGDSGNVYHDPKGFVLAQRNGSTGQVSYRDNSYANRLVVPPNSEVFNGGMSDSAAASVIAHETGHMIMDQLYETPNYPRGTYSGPHAKNSITDPQFALSEGWAEAIETIANKDRLSNPTSWRLKTQKNIVDNKYVFKNQGVIEGVSDGILKNGTEQLSTEGVNATLFYKMLQNNRIQAPFDKVATVFQESKPQSYLDFVKAYVNRFPEDRSNVIKQFLDTTKYTTVDPSAASRYKAVFDAEQALAAAPAGSAQRAQLETRVEQMRADYDAWREQLYKQAVVDGRVDSAVGSRQGGGADLDKQYSSVKRAEIFARGQSALVQGWDNAKASIKSSFSVKNVAMTAGISIGVNLASQVLRGDKVNVKSAFQAIASAQFVGNVVGSGMGAAAGHLVAPIIQAFVPIPIVGAIAGSLIPTMASIAGGQFGGNLGAKMSFKEAIKALDPVAIAGQAVGSTVGAMLGSMIPIPYVGTVLGGMIGGILGEKLFTGIAKLFGRDKKKPASSSPVSLPALPPAPLASMQTAQPAIQSPPATPAPVANTDSGAASVRLPSSLDRIPYASMHPNLRAVKDEYEKAYQDYVQALSGGNQVAQSKLNAFVQVRERYRRALGAYLK